MQLVEQHRIDQHDPRFASKNLYNASLSMMRQLFLRAAVFLSYEELVIVMQEEPVYQDVPAKVAQWVLKQVHQAWVGDFVMCTDYQAHPKKYLGHPRLPKYLDKAGRNLLVFTTQAISRAKKNEGWIVPSGLDIRVATKQSYQDSAQVRIVPKATHYVVEVVYTVEPEHPPRDPHLIASIDIGVNN